MKILKGKKIIVSLTQYDWKAIGTRNKWIKKSNIIDFGKDNTDNIFGKNVPYANNYNDLESGVQAKLNHLKSFYENKFLSSFEKKEVEGFSFFYEENLWPSFLEFIRKEYNVFLKDLKNPNIQRNPDKRFEVIKVDDFYTISLNIRYLSVVFNYFKKIYFDYSQEQRLPDFNFEKNI